MTLKELLKSANICQSYSRNKRGTVFFDSVYIYSTKQSKTKQRCVMGIGMCLYAQLVQTKNKQCKSANYNVIIGIYLTSVPDPN